MTNDRFVTIATFNGPVEAELSRNHLEAAGIRAFVADAELAGMLWHLTTAVGGVKLQVMEKDAEMALQVLGDQSVSEELLGDPGVTEPDDMPAEPEEVEEPEIQLTRREENADRALRAAMLGVLLLPIEIYAFCLLLRVFVSDERLGPKQKNHAIIAAIVNIPYILLICLTLREILAN